MAAISYFAIEEALRDAIVSDPDLETVRGFIEEDLIFSPESAPAVYIYLESRAAFEEDQRLSAGRRTDYTISLTVWCVEWHQDSVSEAARSRDSLIAKVELAIMRDRTLGGLVDSLWLDGGEFQSGFGEQGFISAGEIRVMARAGAVL